MKLEVDIVGFVQVLVLVEMLNAVFCLSHVFYSGDLIPLFDAMRASLGIGGYAAFTLENVSSEDEAT